MNSMYIAYGVYMFCMISIYSCIGEEFTEDEDGNPVVMTEERAKELYRFTTIVLVFACAVICIWRFFK